MLSLKRVFFWIFAALLAETGLGVFSGPPLLFPHLGLLILMYAAIEDGPAAGARVGLWLGFLLDLLGLERFGTFTLTYGLVGMLAGFLHGKVFVEAFVSQWFIPACAFAFILVIAAFVGRSDPEEPTLPLLIGLAQNSSFLTTIAVSPFVFRWCGTNLVKRRAAARARFPA